MKSLIIIKLNTSSSFLRKSYSTFNKPKYFWVLLVVKLDALDYFS